MGAKMVITKHARRALLCRGVVVVVAANPTGAGVVGVVPAVVVVGVVVVELVDEPHVVGAAANVVPKADVGTTESHIFETLVATHAVDEVVPDHQRSIMPMSSWSRKWQWIMIGPCHEIDAKRSVLVPASPGITSR